MTTTTIQANTEPNNDRVVRHSKTVRFVHWAVALSGLVLLFSGIGQMPVYKRYYITSIPGLGWSADYNITLVMHLIAAAVFGAAILYHLIYHWRRHEFSALPRRGDVGESVKIIKAMLTGKQEPPHEKFLAEQRLAYAAMGLTSLVLLITGLIKVYKNTGVIILPPDFLTAITLIHTAATPIFLFLLVAHLGAFLIKENWPLFPSMFTGYVKREYAEHRHPLWQYDTPEVKKSRLH